MFIPRRVSRVLGNGPAAEDNSPRPLEDFRGQAAWVLLGEPGAGKSRAFAEEATATGGSFLSIAEFLIEDSGADTPGKALFLDGLDEIRGNTSGESILLQVRARLKKLGRPPFRIACRAADWFGSTDQETLRSAAPDDRLEVLRLEPLSEDEIMLLLGSNPGVTDPAAFVAKANALGIEALLCNPQTLELLAQAIRGERWPETRQRTFELACETLADDANRQHRNQTRYRPPRREDLLDAAGQLCAGLLMSDKAGIALDQDTADARFPALADFDPPALDAARAAVGRPIFIPASSGQERVVPSHRSISEYLAARWLAQKIDSGRLPLGRVLNLLLGVDGRTVAGLRGLYAWLALHCSNARRTLIEADPLTVVVYGDVKPMSKTDKQLVLAGLRREAERYAGFRWESHTTESADTFLALADPDLSADFIAALETPDRSDAAQSFADCVLDILANGSALTEMAPKVKNLISDDTRWDAVRKNALRSWLRLDGSARDALELLDAVSEGRIADEDDELAGLLLRHLYPSQIAPESLFTYLHHPKNRNHTGRYAMFWEHDFPQSAPEAHLPVLLDHLAARTDLQLSERQDFHLSRMASGLLSRGIALQGDAATDERLFVWLGIGGDIYGHSTMEKEDRERIASWLGARPDRYKALLAHCFLQCIGAEHPVACIYAHQHRFHGAATPEDLGCWHLEHASSTVDDALAEIHLREAVNALMYQQGSRGLTLEQIEAWGELHPQRKHWLEPMLAWEIPEWQRDRAERHRARKQQHTESKRQRSVLLGGQLEEIRSGKANAVLMHELAGVWLDHYTDTHGATAQERFESYCENSAAVLSAAESGFRLCFLRDDLPTVADIISLSNKQHEHFIRRPCLVGMELLWRDGPQQVVGLPEECLRCAVAFRLTYGADQTPQWFLYLVKERSTLVAKVLIDYVGSALKAKHEFIDGIYPLANDTEYRAVACIVAPVLLERFPLRCTPGQLKQLDYLLKAALRCRPDALAPLVEKKLAVKRMDVAQKMYWHATAMLLDPDKYEAPLWDYVGDSWTRANDLSRFVSGDYRGLRDDFKLSARTISKLIELLAPHAELDWGRSGWVNEAMQRGDHVRSMVGQLGALATEAAATELERLLGIPALAKLKPSLEAARHQLRLKQRENAFRFPPLSGVVQILANQDPTGTPDLAALTLDHLDDFCRDIRQDNSDIYRRFWTEAATNAPKQENSCRDVVLEHLRARLQSFHVDCQPESDHVGDKRADIRLSFRSDFDLPIEIKRDSNDSLWKSLRSQLIDQYACSPKAGGYGIYLVLWFGGQGMPPANDGGKKPRSPSELRTRLEAQLDSEERKRIFVRVLDVSWPGEKPSHS